MERFEGPGVSDAGGALSRRPSTSPRRCAKSPGATTGGQTDGHRTPGDETDTLEAGRSGTPDAASATSRPARTRAIAAPDAVLPGHRLQVD